MRNGMSRTQVKHKEKQMNNVTELKANEFDGVKAEEMSPELRRKAIIAELARLGFDDPEDFLDKGEDGFRLTEEEAQGLDERVYDTLDNGWDDLSDSVDDECIGEEDWFEDTYEDDGDCCACMGTVWDRYVAPCILKNGENHAFTWLGEKYDWEPTMDRVDNIGVAMSYDSPYGDSRCRVQKIFARYARLFELGMAHEDYCLAWDAMIADCVHGKNDILDEIAFCAVMIEPDMWEDQQFLEMWHDSAKWNYNCRKYGV